jgi:hypothetical protein
MLPSTFTSTCPRVELADAVHLAPPPTMRRLMIGTEVNKPEPRATVTRPASHHYGNRKDRQWRRRCFKVVGRNGEFDVRFAHFCAGWLPMPCLTPQQDR